MTQTGSGGVSFATTEEGRVRLFRPTGEYEDFGLMPGSLVTVLEGAYSVSLEGAVREGFLLQVEVEKLDEQEEVSVGIYVAGHSELSDHLAVGIETAYLRSKGFAWKLFVTTDAVDLGKGTRFGTGEPVLILMDSRGRTFLPEVAKGEVYFGVPNVNSVRYSHSGDSLLLNLAEGEIWIITTIRDLVVWKRYPGQKNYLVKSDSRIEAIVQKGLRLRGDLRGFPFLSVVQTSSDGSGRLHYLGWIDLRRDREALALPSGE